MRDKNKVSDFIKSLEKFNVCLVACGLLWIFVSFVSKSHAKRGQKEGAMRYGKLVCLVLVGVAAAGCRDAQMYGDAVTGPPEALCVEADDGEPDMVALVSPACGGQCDGGEGARYFEVTKAAPISFSLYGVAGVEYCVELSRTSGYITISHERGKVTRKGDLFTWCITPKVSEDSELMMVRSFTASAGFNLAVP